jgi:Kef-type K+ transport system membrane component KefB
VTTDAITAYVIGDIALILGLSAVLERIFRRLGQPAVIAQILLGILLGPVVLGQFPGHLVSHLFPSQIIPYLTVLAQVAVVIFMFGVGYEIDSGLLHGRSRSVSFAAAGALGIPLALGMSLVLLYPTGFTDTGQHNVHTRSFILFIGVATSVTALPVLASIVRERGLAGTIAGTVATSTAGIMDVCAWLVLAAAVAGTSSAQRPWAETALLLVALVAIMLLAVRPALRWVRRRSSVLASYQVQTAIVLAMADAWATAHLGLHPVFGAFLAGLTLRDPDGRQDADVLHVLESAGGLLLPLFFVVTGLSLTVGGLRSGDLVLFVLIVFVATAGKLVPSYIGARLGGLDAHDSATVAALLNTRGMTELIALSVGLETGIIHRTLFTLLVGMALLTTAMTTFLLDLISRRRLRVPPRVTEPVR